MPVPTVRSRRLAGILRDKRRAAGRTQAEVARHLGRTVRWVSRTETPAECRPSVGDVRALLAFYRVTDPAEVDAIAAIAAEVREPGWWHEYDLPSKLATFVALETEAAAGFVWESSLVPGLLQTEAYARAVISAGPDWLAPDRIDALVSARARRQKILHREEPLHLAAIIDEAVLRRVVGGREVMAEQLARVREAAEAPNVTVRLLLSSAGAHPGQTGPFTILRYGDKDGRDVLYCENPAGGMYYEDEADVQRAHRAFGRLGSMSLSPARSIAFIRETGESLSS